MRTITLASRRAQRGAVLVMGLILLALLLVLGVSAVVVSNVQMKVTGNLQFQNLALSTAESSLAVAESWLTTVGANGLPNFDSPAFISGGTAGLYPSGKTIDPLSMKWDDTNSVKVDSAGKQRYAIELYMPSRTLPASSVSTCNTYGLPAPCPKVNLYRVSARGTDQLGSTRVVQSLYAVRITK